VLPHRSLRANIMWQLSHSGAAARRSSQYASVGFDSFISEVLSTLAFGGELFVVPSELRLRSADLLRWIADHRLTRVFLPYVGLQALASASTDGDPELAVEQLYVAGEQLVVTPAIRALFRRHPGMRLINRYGPSETHCVACHELDGRPDAWETRAPIGLPFGPCEFVLSPAEGGAEVAILGDPVGLGYLPADSPGSDRFGALPASDGTIMPSYRTGDLMEYRNGLLYFVGRADNQVKLRGFRVELEGVEAAACQVPGVQYACAVIEPAPSGADVLRLALVVTGAADGDRIRRSVSRELGRSLPPEVLPQSYHLLPRLPVTERGKVDRGAVLRAVAVFR
jgi:non-ribosomal peptide synthetase component F